ncbi:F-box-like domain protein [Metarhizium robertsii]|uniref:F-box-like domain protein n=1 Tax=Metarhizium robertsii TaxID=568076 RepID=A0A014NFL6_9HYPO|nr:F-box-like domain protein [Metarhizium robertsii]
MRFRQTKLENYTQHARDPDHGSMAADIYHLDERGERFIIRLPKGPQTNKNRPNNLQDAERKRNLAGGPSAEELRSSKRVRLDQDDQEAPGSPQSIRQNMASRLPAEAWHHVFTFVPPRTLGSLMLVNKQFNSYLDPSSGFKSTRVLGTSDTRSLPRLESDAIWQASRRLFWPRMPAALEGRSELEMWRLCCSRVCQFCKFRDDSAADISGDQWRRGPGAKGVSPVFPFFIVSCGRCLRAKSTTEIDLLLNSSTPSALLPGLPMVFLSQENHVVPPHVLVSTTSLSHAQPIKVFWNEQIENIKSAFEDAKGLGPAAAEEWIKGLGQEGKRCLADVARWERWHIAGGVYEMHRLSPRSCVQTAANNQELTTRRSPDSGRLAITANKSVEMKPAKARTNGEHREDLPVHHDCLPASGLTDLPAQENAPVESAQTTSIEDMTVSDCKSKPTSEEAEILKAARRDEIERRAKTLKPPILPNVLAHMPAFHEALQSTKPLNAKAWQVLRPRFLLQRKEAEIKERELQANKRKKRKKKKPKHLKKIVSSTHSSDGVLVAADPHGPRGVAIGTNADWDQAQGLLRGQISEFADEIIQNEWRIKTVTEENAPQFAADILLYVRNKFYAKIANDVKADKASGIEPPEGPWTQKLTLEDMKWVFDEKIKPYTNAVRKNVFRCNGCARSKKFYKLYGVLWHYASNHTKALSLGNLVIHWRAEWPKKPVFKADSQRFAEFRAEAKTEPSDNSLLRIPELPQSVTAQPGLEYSPYTPDLGMSLSTNHGTDVQSAKAPTPNLEYLDHIVMVAKKTWRKLAKVKGLQNSTKHSEAAPLKLFIRALKTHNSMSQLGSVPGLSCKPCKQNSHSSLKSKDYTLVKLSRHFDRTHSNQVVSSIDKPLDWQDMIWLPETSTLTNLRSVIGDDKEVLDVVSDALPWAFETPGCGHGAGRNDNSYAAVSRSPKTEWQQPSALAEVTFRCSNQRSAVPCLELDGFEVIEQPAVWSRRHDRIHDESHTRLPQHGIPPPPSTPRHMEYRRTCVNQQGYTKPVQTISAMSSRYNTHLGNGYENDHTHVRRQAHHIPYPQYESHALELYEIVEVFDPYGSYFIKRPVRPPSQREMHYEDRPQLCAVSNEFQRQHNHDIRSGERTMRSNPRSPDYEEYDPRFPAASWRG